MRKILLVLVFVSLGSFALKALAGDHTALVDLNGLDGRDLPSSDLLFGESAEERVLSPEEAWALKREGKLDLSTLEPDSASELWNPRGAAPEASLELDAAAEFKFQGVLKSRAGRMRFNASQGRATYAFLIGKKVHSRLMLRTLLLKLGYRLPAMRWVDRIRLSFGSSEEKNAFVNKLIPQQTEGAPSRWVVAQDERSVVIQDVIAMPSEVDSYNLALGLPLGPQRSRVLRGLLLPFGLLNIGESVNKLDWMLGRVDNGYLLIPHSELSLFDCTLDDAKWMMRRLARLTRADFEEVVAAGHYPEAVGRLLTEKLLSRRNTLARLLLAGKERLADIPAVSRINLAPDLVQGQLMRENWEGYASRFAHGEQDSPFEDIEYLVAGKLEAATIGGLVRRMNEAIPQLDADKAFQKHVRSEWTKGMEHYLKTGEHKQTPLGIWAAPSAGAQIIASRDIVTGSFMGSESLVQLADTFGVSGSLGIQARVEGLSQPLTASLGGQAFLSRTYTHLKPLRSFKTAFQVSPHHIFVPLMTWLSARDLKNISSSTGDAAVEAGLDALKDHWGIGESIIVTTTLGLSADAQVGAGIGETFEVSKNFTAGVAANLRAGTQILWMTRLYLQRRSADTIDVYHDSGTQRGFELSLGLNAAVPVLQLKFKKSRTSAQIRHFRSVIGKGQGTELGIRQAILTGSTELLRVVVKPHTFDLKIGDEASSFRLFWWHWRSQNSNGTLRVRTPDERSATYWLASASHQFGSNRQQFAVEAANLLSSIFLSPSWSPYMRLPSVSALNPGQTILGSSKTDRVDFEAEVDRDGALSNLFLRLTSRQEGWSIDAVSIRKRADEMAERYGLPLFEPESLLGVRELKLYQISVQMNLYAEANRRLVQEPAVDQRALLERSAKLNRCDEAVISPAATDMVVAPGPSADDMERAERCHALESVSWIRDGIRNAFKRKDHAKAAEAFVDLVGALRRALVPAEFVEYVGGAGNVYLAARITGFRPEAESSDPILSHSLGKIGNPKWNGPLDAVRSITGVEEGEMRATWLRDEI